MSDLKVKLVQLANEKTERDEALDIAASQIINREKQIAALESKIHTLLAAQSQPPVESIALTTGKRKRENDGEQRANTRAHVKREDLVIEDFFNEPLEYTEKYLEKLGSTAQPDSHSMIFWASL